ncbi:serine-rich adhesin for platelets-like isoform X2 [Littorina saxatilis]|uniref:Uncharacterized protein n=1 Tax=Littorina saxatilis TaxID=31220 RepID=A0AAN9B7V3_9CAEN
MRPLSAHSGLRGPPLNLCDIIQRGYLQQVPMLVNLGSNLESRDATGRTPLMMTAYVLPEEWGVGVARLLIEMGVRMDHRDKLGMNVLHHAAIYERLDLAKVLLNAPDFNVAQIDKFGNTALHYAAMSDNPAMVRLLATNHRRFKLPLTKLNKEARTAREEAMKRANYACVAILDEAISSQNEDNNKSGVKSRENSISVPVGNGVAGSADENGSTVAEEIVVPVPSENGMSHSRANSISVFKENGMSNSRANSVSKENATSHSRANSISKENVTSHSRTNSISAVAKENGVVTAPRESSASHSRANSISASKDSLYSRTNSLSGQKENGISVARSRKNSLILRENSNSEPRMFVTEVTKLPFTNEDEEGGLFPRCDPTHQEQMVKKMMSPYQSPLTSDRSSESKTKSSDSCQKSKQVRSQSAARCFSPGSDSSSRSGGSAARKPPLLNKRRKTNTTSGESSSNTETQRSSENEAVRVSDPGKPGRVSSGQRVRRRSGSSENEAARVSDPGKPSRVSSGQRVRRRSGSSSGLRERVNNLINDNDSIRVVGSTAPKTDSTENMRRETTRIIRSSSRLLLPNEKDPEKEIYVVSDGDFRNTPEYVLKLTKMDFHPGNFHTDSLPVLVASSPPTSVQCEEQSKKPMYTGSWRENVRFLYRHYEDQCSPSWRNAAKPAFDPAYLSPYTPSQEDMDECGALPKDKKRRPSSSHRPGSHLDGVSTSSGAKHLRKPPINKMRKPSTSGPLGGLLRGHSDTGTDRSSSESLATAAQSKKKHDTGSDREDVSQHAATSRHVAKTTVADNKNNNNNTNNSYNNEGSASNNTTNTSRTSGNIQNSGISAGNGSGHGSTAHDRNLPAGMSNSYTVPAVTETLVHDEDKEVQNINAEPTNIDTSKLAVVEDVSDDEN